MLGDFRIFFLVVGAVFRIMTSEGIRDLNQKGDKIYDEETTWCSAAASRQVSVREAMESLAEAITRHCGGKCKVVNDHLGKGYHPTPCPFTYDPSGWMTK